MASPQPFPSVNTGAMSEAASKLQSIASDMSDTGSNVGVLQIEVTGNDAWKGEGATQWSNVTTSAQADANLTNEVFSKGGTLLSQLATDLEGEQQYYNKVNAEMGDAAGSYNPRFNPAPPDWDEPYISAMNASVTRANNLLKSFGDDFTELAALSEGINATAAANRTPGEPGGPGGGKGTTVLATLNGTVTGGDSAADDAGGSPISDDGFEEQVLAELGLTKNTVTVGRGLVPGKFSKGGLPRGATPDALESGSDGYVVELKNVTSLSARTQIRIEAAYAQLTNNPYWVVVPKGANVNSSVVRLAEGTGGGVLYRDPQTGQYTDPSGNQVQVEQGTMKVTGYQATTRGGAGASAGGGTGTSSDPQAPANPVNPANTTGQPSGTNDGGGDGGDGGGDGGDPGIGGGDPDPIVDPFP